MKNRLDGVLCADLTGGTASLIDFGRILLKFLFTNIDRVPKGLPFQNVDSLDARDRIHKEQAIQTRWQHRNLEGRVREGRVDTGDNFIRGVEGVTLLPALGDLAENGWITCSIPHWFTQVPKPNHQQGRGGNRGRQVARKNKHVVCINMARAEDCDPNDTFEISDETAAELDYLKSLTWAVHGWANPNGLITINCMMLSEDSPRNQLVVVPDDEKDLLLGVAPM